MKILYSLIGLIIIVSRSVAQAPSVEIWDRRYGGKDDDEFFSFNKTSDGGYILGGQSQSPLSGNKTQDCRGGYDYWVVKTDSLGNKQWDSRFGTSGDDLLWWAQQTLDGGYILGGFTGSDTDFDKTSAGWGGTDLWLVKTDSTGNKQWDKDYGGTMDDYLYTMQLTKDRGYILGGTSWSGIGGDKTQSNWDTTLQTPDYWIVKIDSLGNKQWDKRFGGPKMEFLTAVIQTDDGGYLLGGDADAADSGGDISQLPYGYVDYWVVKTDSVGNKQWDRRFGGQAGSDNEFESLTQTANGNFMLGGYTTSDSGGLKTQNLMGYKDYWVIKIDTGGDKLWDKDYGGVHDDELVNTSQTNDGGYLFSGISDGPAGGDQTESGIGYWQVWLIKTDSTGNKEWDKTISVGGFGNSGYATQIDSNCYVIVQQTPSGIAGYKTQANWDTTEQSDDYWIVKFCFTGKPEGIQDLTPNLQINVYPNPFSSELDINLAQQGLKQATFTIKNMLGQTVYNQTENNLSENYTKMLDLRYLPNGVYLVEVEVNGERICKEVVKQ